jgi:2,3-dihydroxyphenylpropionate 1,2-dioxygenase
MVVDHGFTQVLDLMFDNLNEFPVIPIMINCGAPPRAEFRRVRLLGEAIGSFCKHRKLRALFLGSGGLSHDPPVPNFQTADTATREAMIVGGELGVEARAAREAHIVKAAIEFAAGRGPSLPPNSKWDETFMDLMKSGHINKVDDWTDDEVTKAAGCGAHEVRTWVASFAALSAASGSYGMDIEFYDSVLTWMTGMGVVRAR